MDDTVSYGDSDRQPVKKGDSFFKPGSPVPTAWRQWWKMDKAHTSRWRKEAKEAVKFLSGKQWSEEDKAALREQLRPCITFDRSSVIIDAISGNEIQSRQTVQYLPREIGDAIPNEVYTEAARWFDQESEAEDEDSEAFVDSLVTGIGVTETRLDFDEDPEGLPACDRFDPLEFYWDAATTKGNMRDARRKWRLRSFSGAEIKERWPHIKLTDADAAFWTDAGSSYDRSGELHSNDPEDRYNSGDEDVEDANENFESDFASEHKRYYVLHLQYWHYVYFYKVDDPFTGQEVEMDEKKFLTLQRKLKGRLELNFVRLRRKQFCQAFMGRVVFEHGPNACDERFTWNVITGKRDRQHHYWYGLYRALKDPQMWANKWLSQILHIMNSNSKGGLIYETGVFENQTEAENNWSDPAGMVEVRAGALTAGRVKERTAAQFPAGFQILMEFAIHAIRDVTGVNLEFLGQREATQAGVLEYQRRQAGMTVLAPLFNSLKRYRKGRGRLMLYYIHNYLSDGRLIRIAGDEYGQYVQLTRQADAKYDIIVDDAPTSPNQKEVVWQNFMQILPGVKDVVPPTVLLQILDYSPLPASVVRKIKEAASAKTPEQQQQAQLAARAAIAEVMETEATSKLRLAQAEKALAEARSPDGAEGGGPEPLDPSEVAQNTATAMDRMAAARLKAVQAEEVRSRIRDNRTRTIADVLKMGTETSIAKMKAPAETDLIRAQAVEKRRPKPVSRSLN